MTLQDRRTKGDVGPPDSGDAPPDSRDRRLRALEDLAKFPSENPNPILRVAGDGAVLYANDAAHALPGLLVGDDDGALAADLGRAVVAAGKAGKSRQAEFAAGERTFVFAVTPVAGESYVNLYGRDVTLERRANAEARSLARFPSENPNPVLRVAEDGAVLYANEAARALPGLLDDDGGEVLSQVVAESVVAAHRSAENRQAEFVSGERTFVFALTPVEGESYVNLYGRDVTDERRAHEQAENLARFPSENPNPVLRVAGDATVLYANEAARALAGLLRVDGEGVQAEGVAGAVAAAHESGENRQTEFESGGRIFVFALTPIAGKDYVNLYGRDVTEERRAHQRIIEIMHFNENILQNLSNGVITLDLDLKVTKANPAALRVLRAEEGDVVERAAADIFAGDNAWVMESLSKVISEHAPEVLLDKELRVIHDERVAVNMTIVPMTDVDHQTIGYMLVADDITRETRIKSTMVRFMSDSVVERLLDVDESLLVGTDQEVTILFSDIRQFTTLSEKLGPSEMVAILNDYFAAMVDVIFEHGGTLDKFIGDAIMAVFGAPFVTEEDTDNAVAAAIEMLVRLRDFNDSLRASGRTPLEIGVGIDTGSVVAGTIGSPKRMDYTVIGDHVNLASRVESANKYYGTRILISQHTLEGLRHDYRVRLVDWVRVQGRDDPVTLYEVLDYHSEASFPNMDAVLAAFAQGLEHYRHKRWYEGAEKFAQALQGNPHDRPTQIFLGRCWSHMARPPDESWSWVTDISKTAT